MKHILFIEDDESLNRGVSLKLRKEGYRVETAFTAAEARELFRAGKPELVICDVGLPDGSGLDLCREMRGASDALFLFLTARDAETDIVQGYDMGADDYVTKPFSLMVLLSKVNAMLSRRGGVATAALRSGDIELRPAEKRVYRGAEPLSLTPNEWRLLELFLAHPGHILSRRQLLDCLWDTDSDYIDDNAVAVNIRRLREKIEDDPSQPEYIKNVRGMGYLWDQECEAR